MLLNLCCRSMPPLDASARCLRSMPPLDAAVRCRRRSMPPLLDAAAIDKAVARLPLDRRRSCRVITRFLQLLALARHGLYSQAQLKRRQYVYVCLQRASVQVTLHTQLTRYTVGRTVGPPRSRSRRSGGGGQGDYHRILLKRLTASLRIAGSILYSWNLSTGYTLYLLYSTV